MKCTLSVYVYESIVMGGRVRREVSSSVEELCVWLEENGVWWERSALEIREHGCEAGRGVVALRDVHAGEIIAKIPERALLSTRNVTPRFARPVKAIHALAVAMMIDEDEQEEDQESEEEEEEHETGGASPADDIALAAAVMAERSLGDKSRFHGYLSALPQCEPLAWTWPQSLASTELGGTELDADVLGSRADAVKRAFEHCVKDVLRGFTEEDFIAAMTIVESRAFVVDEVHGTSLVPFADMLNHKYSDLEDVGDIAGLDDGIDGDDDARASPRDGGDADAGTTAVRYTRQKSALLPQALLCVGSDGERGMTMRMLSNVSRGSEIFNTYGEMNNAGLLLTRGFCLWNQGMCVGTPIEIVNIRLETLLSASEAMRCTRGRAARDRLDFLAVSRFFFTSPRDAVADSFEDDDEQEEGADEATVLPQYFSLSLDEDIDPRLVAAAHVLSMTAAEWVAVRRRGGTDASHAEENKRDANDPPTCIAHEVSQLSSAGSALVLEALRLRSNEYIASSSLDEDLALMRTHTISDSRKLHACRLRASERRVLRACASRLKKRKRVRSVVETRNR